MFNGANVGGQFRLLKLFFPSTSRSCGIVWIVESAPEIAQKSQKSHSAMFLTDLSNNMRESNQSIKQYQWLSFSNISGTPWKFNLVPESLPSQNKSSFKTSFFRGELLNIRGVYSQKKIGGASSNLNDF